MTARTPTIPRRPAVPLPGPLPVLLPVLLLAYLAAAGTASAQELIVDPQGPLTTLTEALTLARPGDRIVVRTGVYREPTLVVDKPVAIVGEGWPVLDGEGMRQIMTVTADSVVLRGLEFRHVGVSYMEDRAAVRVEGARHCEIAGNRFLDTFFAIYLARAADCRVVGNTITGVPVRESAAGNGIHLWYSRDVIIEGNTIEGHRDGIYLEFTEGAQVRRNHSRDNLRYGLHFMFSDHCRYEGNRFERNDAGVAVMYASEVEMVGNHFADNWGAAAYGLLLKDIDDSRVEGNVFAGNTLALYVEGTNRITVAHNDFHGNGWAIKVMANAMDNRFTANNFSGNTFDVATNSRSSYSVFEANYWARYAGYDLDRDGFGDVAFRPVRLFALLVERHEPALILLRSVFVDLLDTAERILPALSPEALIDARPRMKPYARAPAVRSAGTTPPSTTPPSTTPPSTMP